MQRLFLLAFPRWLLLFAISLPAPAEEITVSAAASLTNAFQTLAREFEALHPDTRIHLNLAGSGALLAQITRGAPVDVFASADLYTMDQAASRGLIDPSSRHNFAQNTLVLILPAKTLRAISPVTDLAQLADSGLQYLAIGNPDSVPAGRYAKQALTDAGLLDNLAEKLIYTQHVRQALDYVARGEVSAGIVYATDAALMPERVTVASTLALDTPIQYPIAALRDSPQPALARAFIAYILSPAGQVILAHFGFSPLPAATS